VFLSCPLWREFNVGAVFQISEGSSPPSRRRAWREMDRIAAYLAEFGYKRASARSISVGSEDSALSCRAPVHDAD
jgi:hypothetical protein